MAKAQEQAFREPLECKLDDHMLTHSFLHVPECPIPLLGRDILHKFGATTHPTGEKLETGVPLDKGHMMIMLMAEDKPLWTEQVDLPGLNPMVWAQGWGAQEETVPSPSGGLVGQRPCYTGPN